MILRQSNRSRFAKSQSCIKEDNALTDKEIGVISNMDDFSSWTQGSIWRREIP